MTEPQTEMTNSAVAPAPEARPHLDMKPEEMFPETPGGGGTAGLVNQFNHDAPDDGPRDQWVYRITKEMTPAEVLRLFQIAPHALTRKMLEAIDDLYGNVAVKLLNAPIPGIDQTYRHPKSPSRLRRLAEHLADRFLDMVPRAELNFERNRFTMQEKYREARATLEGATAMAGELRDRVVAIERRIFPGVKAATREGQTWRGERMVAVWAGIDEQTGDPTEPTSEPKF
jgi:hypothetical protein